LCTRINRAWGAHIRWTTAHELAICCAARAATRLESNDGQRRVFHAPFACREFTCRVPLPPGATTLSCEGTRLERLPMGMGTTALVEGSWIRCVGEALVCLPLRDGAELTWQ
jgi:hypothetical protein